MNYYATADGSHGWISKGVVIFDYPTDINEEDEQAIDEFLEDGRVIALCAYLDYMDVPYTLLTMGAEV
jgi:hypothetical protein